MFSIGDPYPALYAYVDVSWSHGFIENHYQLSRGDKVPKNKWEFSKEPSHFVGGEKSLTIAIYLLGISSYVSIDANLV